jgi:predicted RNase H-like HicB family nuclease
MVPEGDMTERLVEIEIQRLPEGGYLATGPVLKGLVAQGRTLAETLEIAQDVARKLIESSLEHGDPPPPELSQSLDEPIHLRIAMAPEVEDEYAAEILERAILTSSGARKLNREELLDFEGKVEWTGDLDEMRKSRT